MVSRNRGKAASSSPSSANDTPSPKSKTAGKSLLKSVLTKTSGDTSRNASLKDISNRTETNKSRNNASKNASTDSSFSLDTTGKKKGAALARFHAFQNEETPRTTMQNFMDVHEDSAVTPAAFLPQRDQRRPNEGGSYIKSASTINASELISPQCSSAADISSDASLIGSRPVRKRGDRKRKTAINTDEMDPDKDITQPLNKSNKTLDVTEKLTDDSLEDTVVQPRRRRIKNKKIVDPNEFDFSMPLPPPEQTKKTTRSSNKSQKTLDISGFTDSSMDESVNAVVKMRERKQARKKKAIQVDVNEFSIDAPEEEDETLEEREVRTEKGEKSKNIGEKSKNRGEKSTNNDSTFTDLSQLETPVLRKPRIRRKKPQVEEADFTGIPTPEGTPTVNEELDDEDGEKSVPQTNATVENLSIQKTTSELSFSRMSSLMGTPERGSKRSGRSRTDKIQDWANAFDDIPDPKTPAATSSAPAKMQETGECQDRSQASPTQDDASRPHLDLTSPLHHDEPHQHKSSSQGKRKSDCLYDIDQGSTAQMIINEGIDFDEISRLALASNATESERNVETLERSKSQSRLGKDMTNMNVVTMSPVERSKSQSRLGKDMTNNVTNMNVVTMSPATSIMSPVTSPRHVTNMNVVTMSPTMCQVSPGSTMSRHVSPGSTLSPHHDLEDSDSVLSRPVLKRKRRKIEINVEDFDMDDNPEKESEGNIAQGERSPTTEDNDFECQFKKFLDQGSVDGDKINKTANNEEEDNIDKSVDFEELRARRAARKSEVIGHLVRAPDLSNINEESENPSSRFSTSNRLSAGNRLSTENRTKASLSPTKEVNESANSAIEEAGRIVSRGRNSSMQGQDISIKEKALALDGVGQEQEPSKTPSDDLEAREPSNSSVDKDTQDPRHQESLKEIEQNQIQEAGSSKNRRKSVYQGGLSDTRRDVYDETVLFEPGVFSQESTRLGNMTGLVDQDFSPISNQSAPTSRASRRSAIVNGEEDAEDGADGGEEEAEDEADGGEEEADGAHEVAPEVTKSGQRNSMSEKVAANKYISEKSALTIKAASINTSSSKAAFGVDGANFDPILNTPSPRSRRNYEPYEASPLIKSNNLVEKSSNRSKNKSINHLAEKSSNRSENKSTTQLEEKSSNRSKDKSATQLAEESTNRSENKSNRSKDKSATQLAEESINHSQNKSATHLAEKSSNRSKDKSVTQLAEESINRSKNKSTTQLEEKSSNRSKNKSTNRSVHQETEKSASIHIDGSMNKSTKTQIWEKSSADVETEQVSVATQDYEDAGTQCYQTPGYLREARRSIISNKNKSLQHSLYQSRLIEDDIMEGGTQTTPTVNLENFSLDKIENLRKSMMSETASQVTPSLAGNVGLSKTLGSLQSRAVDNRERILSKSIAVFADNETTEEEMSEGSEGKSEGSEGKSEGSEHIELQPRLSKSFSETWDQVGNVKSYLQNEVENAASSFMENLHNKSSPTVEEMLPSKRAAANKDKTAVSIMDQDVNKDEMGENAASKDLNGIGNKSDVAKESSVEENDLENEITFSKRAESNINASLNTTVEQASENLGRSLNESIRKPRDTGDEIVENMENNDGEESFVGSSVADQSEENDEIILGKGNIQSQKSIDTTEEDISAASGFVIQNKSAFPPINNEERREIDSHESEDNSNYDSDENGEDEYREKLGFHLEMKERTSQIQEAIEDNPEDAQSEKSIDTTSGFAETNKSSVPPINNEESSATAEEDGSGFVDPEAEGHAEELEHVESDGNDDDMDEEEPEENLEMEMATGGSDNVFETPEQEEENDKQDMPGRKHPNNRMDKEMKQATLDRYLGVQDKTADVGISHLITPEVPAAASKAKKPAARKKPTPVPKTVFPAKNIKFDFQRFSRFKVKKDAEGTLCDASQDFMDMAMKRLTAIVEKRGASKIHLCDIKQLMVECNFIPENDDRNLYLYEKLRNTVREDAWMELIPRAVGDGTVYPSKGCWEDPGRTKKGKRKSSGGSSDENGASGSKKKRTSTSKVKRFKVPNAPAPKKAVSKPSTSRSEDEERPSSKNGGKGAKNKGKGRKK